MDMIVTIPAFPFIEPLQWAEEHCPSYITVDIDDHTKMHYHFADEKDAVMFILRWA
jgi:hypothetical protein